MDNIEESIHQAYSTRYAFRSDGQLCRHYTDMGNSRGILELIYQLEFA